MRLVFGVASGVVGLDDQEFETERKKRKKSHPICRSCSFLSGRAGCPRFPDQRPAKTARWWHRYKVRHDGARGAGGDQVAVVQTADRVAAAGLGVKQDAPLCSGKTREAKKTGQQVTPARNRYVLCPSSAWGGVATNGFPRQLAQPDRACIFGRYQEG